MDITVVRLHDDGVATLGKLFIGSQFECFTLEDDFDKVKQWGKTRIPAGVYEMTLRTFGPHHEKYKDHKDSRIRKLHQGMLWVRDVPNYTDILHHIGNYHQDTAGCLLVGKSSGKDNNGNHKINNSTDAYVEYYEKVVTAILNCEKIKITYLDADRS